ncbi:MAG: VWA domain-containing protein, partial [Actinobacteria bacterium]|nr:VWA domain-containing protein [Actinomycetota bacterium]
MALAFLVTFSLGCSARGGGSGRGDGGGGTLDSGGFDGGGTDSTVRRDSTVTPGDSSVWMDAGCESTTPVGTTIIGDPPDMLLVVDISGSMCTPLFGTGSMETKMSIMKTALEDLVDAYDARINFGLMLYPGDGECGPGGIDNPIMARNASAIRSTLSGLTIDFFGCALAHPGATPTHTSIDAARSYYGTIPVNPIGRYALLATDGLPNCGPELPDGGTEETVDETVTAIGNLASDGIDTYVLGFGSDITGDPTALNRMATAGGTGMPYSATSAAELATAFDTIAAEVVPPS